MARSLKAHTENCFQQAEAGVCVAQLQLGLMYSTGQKGALLDYVAAHKWLNLAALRGNDEATLRLARESARIAGTRGFRLWSLTARMILTDVGQGDGAAQAPAAAKLLAQDICRALPENRASSFRTRRGIGALLAET